MLMTDCIIEEHEDTDDAEMEPRRAIVWGTHVCVQCEDPCIAAPIPTRHGYKCGPCSIRPHLLPFIVERLARREVSRAGA